MTVAQRIECDRCDATTFDPRFMDNGWLAAHIQNGAAGDWRHFCPPCARSFGQWLAVVPPPRPPFMFTAAEGFRRAVFDRETAEHAAELAQLVAEEAVVVEDSETCDPDTVERCSASHRFDGGNVVQCEHEAGHEQLIHEAYRRSGTPFRWLT